MPVGLIKIDVEAPSNRVGSDKYGAIYAALYQVPEDKWIAIPITHTKDTRLREIANVRRSVQRWFGLKAHLEAGLKMESRVVSVDEFNSVMYILKKGPDEGTIPMPDPR